MCPTIQPDYAESSMAPLPAGTYFARIVEAEYENHPKSGQIIKWELEVFGNPEKKFNGKGIYHRTNISGQFSGYLKLFLQAINPNYAGEAFDTDDYIGKELEVTIAYDIDKQTGQPSQYSKIKKVAPYVAVESDVPY